MPLVINSLGADTHTNNNVTEKSNFKKPDVLAKRQHAYLVYKVHCCKQVMIVGFHTLSVVSKVIAYHVLNRNHVISAFQK